MKMGVCVKLKMLVSAICVVILLAMTGCKKEMYTPDEPVVDPENVFDFSTREKYTLHVKYDVPENYKVYFEVYTKDPELLDADGQVVKRDIEPVDVGFTDGNGEYNHKIEKAIQTIEPITLNKESSKLLNRDINSLALKFDRKVYTKDQSILEYTISIFTSDKHQYQIMMTE